MTELLYSQVGFAWHRTFNFLQPKRTSVQTNKNNEHLLIQIGILFELCFRFISGFKLFFCVTDLGVKTSRHGGSGSGEHQRSGQIIPHIATLSSSQNVTPPPVFSEPPAGPADSVTEAQPKTQHGENFTFHQKHAIFRSSDLYLDEFKKKKE